MKSLLLSKVVPQAYQKKIIKSEQLSRSKSTSGYTLPEIIITVMIIGVLAAIAAPGWLAFINRQRVNKANDAVLGILQRAQREAKNKKLPYQVSFKTDTYEGTANVPQVAIYPVTVKTADAGTTGVTGITWQLLGGDVNTRPGDIWLGTNLTANNKGGKSTPVRISDATPRTITFDDKGAVASDLSNPDLPIKIVVAAPLAGQAPIISNQVKRCVIVDTLIGGIRTARNEECTRTE